MKSFKINRKIKISGVDVWIRANTEQEYAEKVMQLSGTGTQVERPKHLFSEYAKNWFETYSKPGIASVTAESYRRQIDVHLIPVLGNLAVEDISVEIVQKLFNGMGGAKATKEKTKTVLNMILEMAVEDQLLPSNPLKSKRFKLSGAKSTTRACYTLDQMRYIVANIDRVKDPTERTYIAIQALSPLRPEEVLGLKWENIDLDNMLYHIVQVVTHPKRNMPEIKPPKTESSARTVPISEQTAKHLVPGEPDQFVLGGKEPLSYTKLRNMCKRIAADMDFPEGITPSRFRTTVLTDLYETTKDIKLTQAMAGHTTAAMTLQHYVKGRGTNEQASHAIDSLYS